jgi:hypothetical protein
MATLIIDGHYIAMTEQNVKDSQIVSDMVDDGDTQVPLMVGTYEQAIRAVEAITLLRKFCDVVEKFNHPDKGTATQQLVALKTDIACHYKQLQTLILDNEVYDWLYPVNDLVRVVCDYEHAKSVAGWYKDKDIPDDYQVAFQDACENCHLSIAKWLYGMGGVDIHVSNDDTFQRACRYGHLSITKWLYGLGGVNIHAYDDYAFRWACINGHESIAKCLYSLGGVDIHINYEFAFRWACGNGQESIAKWLYGIGGVDIHADDDDAFQSACQDGYESIAKWLYSLGGVDIHAYDEAAFRYASENGHESIAKWLKSLD